MTDTELVRAARERDPEAWRELCERYLPVVWRYAYMLLSDTHVAQDITSETMLALVKNICQLKIEDPQVAAWLRSVVRHKVADFHRGNYRLRSRLQTYAATQAEPEIESTILANLEAAETRELVLQVLEQLPESHRTLLEWKYGEGLRVREMARRLDKTEKGIEAALYRARQEFRRVFERLEKAQEEPLAGQVQASKLSEIDSGVER